MCSVVWGSGGHEISFLFQRLRVSTWGMLLYIRGTSKRFASGLLEAPYVLHICVGLHYFKVRGLYELGI